jgi:hypothetical protein
MDARQPTAMPYRKIGVPEISSAQALPPQVQLLPAGCNAITARRVVASAQLPVPSPGGLTPTAEAREPGPTGDVILALTLSEVSAALCEAAHSVRDRGPDEACERAVADEGVTVA